ncbi:MAG: translocation/assembly module TamB domain-containing protein, partial [Rhodothermales bacterium]
QAQLQPLSEAERGGIRPGLLIQDSRLAVEGTFRLPGYGADDNGALALEVDIARAEAFFFEYIFKEIIADVHGYLTGSGSVGGDFSKPLFTASAELFDGGFRVPEFQLQYEANGALSVDERGIHLDGLNLRDPDGGRAAIQGSVLFNDYRYFSFNLAGELNELRVMNVTQSRELPFYGRIDASGRVTLTGPLSNTTLRSTNVVTSAESDLYIPIMESDETTDPGFIVFADSAGILPDIQRLTRRENLLAIRPAGERQFLDGMDMDLNISAPQGSTVHLVIDPLLGDVINAVGSGRVQLVRNEGEFETYGAFNVSSGDYLFTAGEVFFRRFLIDSGAITWDGDPLNAVLSIAASYRTRASTAGLAISEGSDRLIPLVINLNVSGRVSSPVVDLALSMDRDERNLVGRYQAEGLQSALNQPELSAQYATSVLLTNSFMLATDAASPLSETPNQLAFNSLSQLVASQLNRYLNYALPNVDLNLGVQGESAQNLDVTYGVALRLLDERLIIRGQGIYESEQAEGNQQGMLDAFIVEVRLSPTISVEVFYRREGDILSDQTLNTNTTGAGLSYQTQFSSWRRFMNRLFGWLVSEEKGVDSDSTAVAAE